MSGDQMTVFLTELSLPPGVRDGGIADGDLSDFDPQEINVKIESKSSDINRNIFFIFFKVNIPSVSLRLV